MKYTDFSPRLYPSMTICVRDQYPFFEAGVVAQQTTFQPGHLSHAARQNYVGGKLSEPA